MRRRHEGDRGPDDDRHLAEPRPDGVEQLSLAVGRADDMGTPAGDDLQFEDVVALDAVASGRGPDTADDERAANRQIEVVGEHRRGEAVRQRGGEHLAPRRAGVDVDSVGFDGVDRPSLRQVDHDAVGDLRAAVDRVALALRRDHVAPVGMPRRRRSRRHASIPEAGRHAASRARCGRSRRSRRRGLRRRRGARRRGPVKDRGAARRRLRALFAASAEAPRAAVAEPAIIRNTCRRFGPNDVEGIGVSDMSPGSTDR